MEVEAVDEGTLGKILVPEGTEDVAVNTPIAMILADGEDAHLSRRGRGRCQAAAAQPKPTPARPPSRAAAKRPGRSRAEGPSPILAKSASAAPQPQSRARAGRAGRHRDGHHDRARGAARRHGRGDAPRRNRVRDGRGGRRIPGRLQGHAGPAAGVRPQRVVDTPITEHGFAGLGVGAASPASSPSSSS
jgi:pyruvate dehydrogenase E1 component beta subunit